MGKIQYSSQAKQAYNRARKSYIQKVRRLEKRGYDVRAKIEDFPSLSKLSNTGTAESDIFTLARKADIRRENIYFRSTFNDPLTGYTFTGTTGLAIEQHRNEFKFRNKRKELRTVDVLDEIEKWRKESFECVREQEDFERYASNPDFDPDPVEEFYDDNHQLGTDNEPKEVDRVVENVEETLNRWDMAEPPVDTSTLISIESEIDGWSPLSNWSESLIEVKRDDRNRADNILQGLISDIGREQVARNIQRNSIRINALLDSILYASGSKEGNFKDGRTEVNHDIVEFSELVGGRKLSIEESERYTGMSERNELNN